MSVRLAEREMSKFSCVRSFVRKAKRLQSEKDEIEKNITNDRKVRIGARLANDIFVYLGQFFLRQLGWSG